MLNCISMGSFGFTGGSFLAFNGARGSSSFVGDCCFELIGARGDGDNEDGKLLDEDDELLDDDELLLDDEELLELDDDELLEDEEELLDDDDEELPETSFRGSSSFSILFSQSTSRSQEIMRGMPSSDVEVLDSFLLLEFDCMGSAPFLLSIISRSQEMTEVTSSPDAKVLHSSLTLSFGSASDPLFIHLVCSIISASASF